MASCRGNSGPSIEGANIKHLSLFFLPHLQFHCSSYLKSTVFLQTLMLLLVIYTGNALWDLFLSEVPLSGFSFFLGLYYQVPHLTYIIGLLPNFVGKYEYMGGVIARTGGTSSASLKCFPDLLSVQVFQGFQPIPAETDEITGDELTPSQVKGNTYCGCIPPHT